MTYRTRTFYTGKQVGSLATRRVYESIWRQTYRAARPDQRALTIAPGLRNAAQAVEALVL